MRTTSVSLFAAVLLAITASAPSRAADLALGKDLAGEACSLRLMDIVCGPVATLGGLLRTPPLYPDLPAADPARRTAIIAAATAIPDSGLAARDAMRCDAGKSVDANTVLFTCTLTSNSWPHIIIAHAAPDSFILAEGLPSLLPVLQAAISAKTGTQMASGLAAVQAVYSQQVLSVGAVDHAGYQGFIAQAGRAAAQRDFAGAEAADRSALDVATRSFGADSSAVGSALMELALQISNQQRFDEAAALFRRATPIIESLPSPAIRARLASYRALDAANQRDYLTALRYARDDVAARQADVDAAGASGLDFNGNVVAVPLSLEAELAHALRIEAEMSMRLDDMPGAQAAAERALYIVTQHPDMPLSWRPDMVALMGEINVRQARVVVAEKDFLDALAMSKKLFGDGAPTIAAELRLGRFYTEEQVYAPALSAYRDAFAALGKQSRALPNTATLDEVAPFFAAATASSDDRVRLDGEMFAASQLFDSGVAGQTIVRVASNRAADNPALAAAVRADDEAGNRRDDLRMALATEQAKPDDQRDVVREKALVDQLAAATSDAANLDSKLRADFPAYAQMVAPGAVSLTSLQQALHPREGFASFLIGVRSSYVLLVTRDSLTVRPLAVTADSLAADITDLRSALVPRLGQIPDFSLANAATLYKDLLGPVATQLAGVDHLDVAASGDLSSLPFALLVTDAGAPRDYVHAAWLIRRMAVAQVPTARAFMALRTNPAPAAPRPFLGLGDPGFSGNAGGQALVALASACQDGASADPALLRSLPPLPETAGEVRTIAAELKGGPDDMLLGAGASEAALRAKPLDQYAVLYFATHGMLPGELHCQAQPGLVLTPPAGAASPSDDGLLTAGEIAGLRLNAGLVVLSACNTAAAGGNGFGGGALEGLADAFFSAGAHAVLASHWEVPSLATTSLMTDMFARRAQDSSHDTAEALRQAQLTLIAQQATAHPYQWAAFTLIGD